MNDLDPLLSAQQLADYLDVPLATLYAWRHRRQGPPGFRAGRHLRYRKSDIDQWINGQVEDSARLSFANEPEPIRSRAHSSVKSGAVE
jgi:excisionase family DNA binding protein